LTRVQAGFAAGRAEKLFQFVGSGGETARSSEKIGLSLLPQAKKLRCDASNYATRGNKYCRQ
jgi:hypothetical protein